MNRLDIKEFEMLCSPHLTRLRALYSNFSCIFSEYGNTSFVVVIENIMKEYPNNKLKYTYNYIENKTTLTVTGDGINYRPLLASVQEDTQPTNNFITYTLYYGIYNTLDKIKYPWLKNKR